MKTAIAWRAAGATGETVNLRSGPGLNYINKYRIPFGTRIEIVEAGRVVLCSRRRTRRIHDERVHHARRSREP